ncbi:MAG TPA: sulfur carrier protein ThiS [Solirubrobacterales bacterium]|nr:sulfur carrier protein ThiS [Solirubrobacterales bacterium]
MRIALNGKAAELPDGASVAEAVAAAGAGEEQRGVAVAVEGEVVPRGEWDATRLRDGQAVEVVRAIQGG